MTRQTLDDLLKVGKTVKSAKLSLFPTIPPGPSTFSSIQQRRFQSSSILAAREQTSIPRAGPCQPCERYIAPCECENPGAVQLGDACWTRTGVSAAGKRSGDNGEWRRGEGKREREREREREERERAREEREREGKEGKKKKGKRVEYSRVEEKHVRTKPL